ncbi:MULTISPECIES: hypothetical protein [Paenibacillus]|uniref:hypothetical protein n=1 Tax=Paenibacillus TaxID=44249 RepID=UPI0022B888B5|nr:hypothetical protein [Paenibacillus caseinilyticus]MCZ8522550.1 hypothetical protein [Paenibacillus caseinilyticus]
MFKLRLAVWTAAAMIFLSVSTYSHAEPEEGTPPSSMPCLTLFDEFKLYKSERTGSSEVIGSLSGNQTVQLAPVEAERLAGLSTMSKVHVVTWLGTAWINLKEGSYKYGELERKTETLTLLQPETALYDSPLAETAYKLAPQQVEAVASMPVCDPFYACWSQDKWYLIRTSWLGEKWIQPYHYAEKYQGRTVEGYISIEEESAVYSYPEDEPLTGEPKVRPQIVKFVAKYVTTGRMVPPTLWYQIDTPQGLRWICMGSEHGLGFENIEPVDLKIDMPAPFHYYRSPSPYEEPSAAQEPQIVHALGRLGDWYFVLTGDQGRWINPVINPDKEPAVRTTGDLGENT